MEGEHPKELAEGDHDPVLQKLLERCQQKNITLNEKKFGFKVDSIKFTGNIISTEGLKPEPEKINSITNMPVPTSKAATICFIGMITYLSKYCPALRNEIKPLKDVSNDQSDFTCGPEQDGIFNTCKKLISQAPTLRYFDVNAPVMLQVDASEDGIGGAILQPNAARDLHILLTYHDRKKYAQIEKGSLAICAAFAKWNQCLYGHSNITIHTNHQPLETILK